MKKTQKLLLISGLVCGLAIAGIAFGPMGLDKLPNQIMPKSASGTLVIQVPDKAVINEPFDISLIMDTKGKNVNAVGTYLKFDASKLQVMQVDTRPSFCQFYPEKKYDNQLGTISLACGSPHPGINGNSTLMIIQFMPISLGQSKLYLDPKSQILESNGKGTNILKDYQAISINVLNNP